MIDAEVIRLRRLRRTALLTRALAHALLSSLPGERAFAVSARGAWSVARFVNGRLKAHPNLRCQQGPDVAQTVIDHALAGLTAWVAFKRGRPYGIFARQVRILARELDDVRALTRSADLGDALGRMQWQLLGCLQDLEVGIRREGVADVLSRNAAQTGATTNPDDWPFLAIERGHG